MEAEQQSTCSSCTEIDALSLTVERFITDESIRAPLHLFERTSSKISIRSLECRRNCAHFGGAAHPLQIAKGRVGPRFLSSTIREAGPRSVGGSAVYWNLRRRYRSTEHVGSPATHAGDGT